MKNPHAVAMGNTTKRRHGRKHYVRIGAKGGSAHRQYTPCAKPRAADPSRRHRFNPVTDTCYGCGLNRSEAKAKPQNA